MNKVKYTARDCKNQEKIEKFLKESRTGVIAMNGDDYPYAVPVNYVWYEGAIFFHGMGSGKKVDILSEEPPVSFTVYEETGTVTDPMPCHADTSYMSVMLFGKIEKVIDVILKETPDKILIYLRDKLLFNDEVRFLKYYCYLENLNVYCYEYLDKNKNTILIRVIE